MVALAHLTSAHLGYGMLVDGLNIYTLDNVLDGTTGRIYRISDDGGATWSLTEYGLFPFSPGDDFRGATVHGGRIYLVTEEDATSPVTEIWSLDAAPASVPTLARFETYVMAEGDCTSIARDDSFYYLACTDGGDHIARVPVGGGMSEIVTTSVPLSLTANALYGDDLDADGVFDVLYVQSDGEAAYVVCGPASATPGGGILVDFGTGSSNYGMGFDATNAVLWMWDDDTRELVSVD